MNEYVYVSKTDSNLMINNNYKLLFSKFCENNEIEKFLSIKGLVLS